MGDYMTVESPRRRSNDKQPFNNNTSDIPMNTGEFANTLVNQKTPNGSPTYKTKTLGNILGTVDEKYETGLMNI